MILQGEGSQRESFQESFTMFLESSHSFQAKEMTE